MQNKEGWGLWRGVELGVQRPPSSTTAVLQAAYLYETLSFIYQMQRVIKIPLFPATRALGKGQKRMRGWLTLEVMWSEIFSLSWQSTPIALETISLEYWDSKTLRIWICVSLAACLLMKGAGYLFKRQLHVTVTDLVGGWWLLLTSFLPMPIQAHSFQSLNYWCHSWNHQEIQSPLLVLFENYINDS